MPGAPAQASGGGGASGDHAVGPEAPGGEPRVVDSRPPPMHQPVNFWERGATERQTDAATAREDGFILLDLGEEWTPYLFTTRDTEESEEFPNAYRETYLALARGEFPDDHHGERARSDKYLELYGIMPTLGVLRERMRDMQRRACDSHIEAAELQAFAGFLRYESRNAGRDFARRHRILQRSVDAMVRAQHVESRAELDESSLSDRDTRRLADYDRTHGEFQIVHAVQQRLECEGYFEGKGDYVEGGLDWATHEALAEFERRHRIYGWGYIGRDTLDMLKRPSLEGERGAVIRVLTERAMHSAGVVEDGSITRPWRDAAGVEHQVPNLEEAIQQQVVEAFGLQTPESTAAFLESLGELPAHGERLVAIPGVELPEYYDGNMDLTVEIDRGDVWYEFPYDDRGRERGQPVERRPRLTIFTTHRGQRIALARIGTTVGGWRSEHIEGESWWRYKNSPVGPVVWHQIVAAPVWLPPESTPPRDLLVRTGRRTRGERFRPNLHETGPSYASAYGLVAAYHLRYRERDGEISLGGDEGIRTHGSVDYMSIMRRHSHGCHRLHNHMAVRLMSFVLAHRRHIRQGQQRIAFRRELPVDDEMYTLAIDQGGYVFQLERPIRVSVLEGRVRGEVSRPIEEPLPRYDSDRGAYMLPDGGAVAISRSGAMHSVPVPLPDAGPVDAGRDAGVPAQAPRPSPLGF